MPDANDSTVRRRRSREITLAPAVLVPMTAAEARHALEVLTDIWLAYEAAQRRTSSDDPADTTED